METDPVCRTTEGVGERHRSFNVESGLLVNASGLARDPLRIKNIRVLFRTLLETGPVESRLRTGRLRSMIGVHRVVCAATKVLFGVP